jgi:phosphatidylglycerophosphate synthase
MNEMLWNTASIVTAILIVVLTFIGFQQHHRSKRNYVGSQKERKMNQDLTTLAMSLIVLGIVFGTDRLIGYSFIFVGILTSIINLIKYRHKT